MNALREFHRILDLVTDEIDVAHEGGNYNCGPGSDHLETLKMMAPTARVVIDRMLGEEISPEGRVTLKSAGKIIDGAIAQYPQVPYFGANPGHEFMVGKTMLGVALRMIENGF